MVKATPSIPLDRLSHSKNSVDDRPVQVSGKQRTCTIDGYAMPLVCRGGLTYLSLLGKPPDEDLERYPAVHLTGPHKWDPSVLERFAFDPNFDDFGGYTRSAIQISIFWMTHPNH